MKPVNVLYVSNFSYFLSKDTFIDSAKEHIDEVSQSTNSFDMQKNIALLAIIKHLMFYVSLISTQVILRLKCLLYL